MGAALPRSVELKDREEQLIVDYYVKRGRGGDSVDYRRFLEELKEAQRKTGGVPGRASLTDTQERLFQKTAK